MILVVTIAALTALQCNAQQVAISGVSNFTFPTNQSPGYPRIAVGEVFYLFVQVDSERLLEQISIEQPVRTGDGWNTSVAGVSAKVTVRGFGDPTEYRLPIGSVTKVGCGLFNSTCNMLRVQAQFPVEAEANNPGPFGPRPAIIGSIVVEIDGARSLPADAYIVPALGRVVGRCTGTVFPGDPCGQVFHADGTEVSPARPARAGDKLHFFAYGLGRTEPAVASGEVAQEGLRPVSGVALILDFARPFLPLLPGASSLQPQVQADSAELVPGEVGTYRVTFTMSQVPRDTGACPSGGPPNSPARANAAMTVYTAASRLLGDVAYFCVQP